MFVGGLMSFSACTFEGEGLVPTPSTTCPSSSSFDMKNRHLDSLTVMPALYIRVRISITVSMCSSNVFVNALTSSM